MGKLRVISEATQQPSAPQMEATNPPLGQIQEIPGAMQGFNVLDYSRRQPDFSAVPQGSFGQIVPASVQRQEAVPVRQAPTRAIRQIIPAEALSQAEELRPWQMSQIVPEAGGMAQAGLGGLQALTFNDEEMVSMLKRIDPEIVSYRDKETNAFNVWNPKTNKAFIINKPGLSGNDLINVVSSVVAALPAGRAATMPGRMAAEAGIQSAIESAQTAAGGEFNIQEPLYAGAFSAGTDLLSLVRQASKARAGGRTVEREAMRRGEAPETATMAGRVSSQAVAPGTPQARAQTFTDIVNADPSVTAAAEQLGLSEVLPARVYSRNPQYVQVEQALANIPGTVMADAEKNAIQAVASKADEFITTFGGTRDLGVLNENIVMDFNNTLDSLRAQSDVLYDQLSKSVPKRTYVDTYEIRRYLVNKARDLGGIDKLNTQEKALYNAVTRQARGGGKKLTYGLIDDLRQDIGEQYGAALKGNRFGDASTHRLSQLYDLLTDVQGSAIEQVAGKETADVWATAKGLVSQRKELESTASSLLGKEFSKPIIPRVRTAISNLLNGDVTTLQQTMDGIPEQYRNAAIISAMDTFFTQGARNQPQLNMGGFSAWWQKLSRSEKARSELLKYMPEGAGKFLDNLATISRQYSSAIASVPRTGVVKAMGDFGSDAGFLAKVLPMVPVVGKKVAGIFSSAPPDAVMSAAELMAHPDFKRIIVRSAQGLNSSRLEQRFYETQAFKKWFDAVPSNYKSRMMTVGLGNYFVGLNEGEQ